MSAPTVWLAAVRVPGRVRIDTPNRQRQAIDAAARAAGRDPSDIATHVRINVAEGARIEQVAEAVRLLVANGYPDAFVDLLYVVTGTDAQLDWVERLLATGAA